MVGGGAISDHHSGLYWGQIRLSFPDIGIRRNNLGMVLQDLGDLAGARAQFERALAISEAALGPEHPHVAVYRGNLAEIVGKLGESEGGL